MQLVSEVADKFAVVHAALAIELEFFSAMKDAAQDSGTTSRSERLITGIAKGLELADRHFSICSLCTCALSAGSAHAQISPARSLRETENVPPETEARQADATWVLGCQMALLIGRRYMPRVNLSHDRCELLLAGWLSAETVFDALRFQSQHVMLSAVEHKARGFKRMYM